jgi:hypothetical protein
MMKLSRQRKPCSTSLSILLYLLGLQPEEIVALLQAGVTPLPSRSFKAGGVKEFLSEIEKHQPAIASDLEKFRSGLWEDQGRCLFDAATTVLFTTHALAQRWHASRDTRIWLHKRFDRTMADSELNQLRDEMTLAKVVFDEIEPDEFLHVLPEGLYQLIDSEQKRLGQWRNLPRHQRLSEYDTLKSSGRIPVKNLEFEGFDELMRLDLSDLEQVKVDFPAMLFGYGHVSTNVYARAHGRVYYVGAQSWFSASSTEWSFLTTEALTGKIVEAVHKRRKRKLISVGVPDVPFIFPVKGDYRGKPGGDRDLRWGRSRSTGRTK